MLRETSRHEQIDGVYVPYPSAESDFDKTCVEEEWRFWLPFLHRILGVTRAFAVSSLLIQKICVLHKDSFSCFAFLFAQYLV